VIHQLQEPSLFLPHPLLPCLHRLNLRLSIHYRRRHLPLLPRQLCRTQRPLLGERVSPSPPAHLPTGTPRHPHQTLHSWSLDLRAIRRIWHLPCLYHQQIPQLLAHKHPLTQFSKCCCNTYSKDLEGNI
jgi:hypothetical protein